VLRDYFDLEFSALKSSLKFDYSLERVLDDFIFLGLMVGNDFIPCLPTFYIPNGTLSLSLPLLSEDAHIASSLL